MYNIPWFPMNLAVMLPLPGGLVLLLRRKEKDLRKCRWRDVIPGYWGLGQGGQACKKTCCSTGNLLRNFGSFWGPCRHLVGSNRESCYVLLIQLFVGFTVTPLVWNRIFPIFPHISTSFPKFFFQISWWSPDCWLIPDPGRRPERNRRRLGHLALPAGEPSQTEPIRFNGIWMGFQ